MKYPNITAIAAIMSFTCAGLSFAQTIYPDGRPSATLRMDAKDQGVVLKHGQGPDKCDMLGARDFWVYESDGTYYMNYDGSGPKGWLACLATSKNLTDLVQQGPCWISANPERKIPLRLRTA